MYDHSQQRYVGCSPDDSMVYDIQEVNEHSYSEILASPDGHEPHILSSD